MRRLAIILTAALAAGSAAAQRVTDSYEIGGEAVITVDAGSSASPIPASFPAAHQAVLALKAKNPRIKQWIVNIDLGGATGVQFIVRGPGQHPAAYDDRWIAQFAFNGASERGAIEAGRWCRGGAAETYPAICREVEAAVERRNVGRLIR